MNSRVKKNLKKVGYTFITLLILSMILIFFTRNNHPTPATPTQQTLALTPFTKNEKASIQAVSIAHKNQPMISQPTINSVPAAEAQVLNLTS